MNSHYAYLTRIVPALSLIGVTILLFVALVVAPYGKVIKGTHHGEATYSQIVLSIYTVLLHLPPVVFPARLCWAIGHVMKKMKETANVKHGPKVRGTGIAGRCKKERAFPSPLFVIIIPAYKETIGTLEETLRVLASHVQARNSYHVYLAMEAKELSSDIKASSLIQSFTHSFYAMSFTVHPVGVPGEAQGKSSNESWAARQAFQDYPQEMKRDVIITIMDADTHLSTRYFAQVAKYHHDYIETNAETIYVPPLVFDRNVHNVPLPVRGTDLVWAGAGLSNLYHGSKICIPTSVYSLPMVLAESVGGWDTGPGAIGEDMHMYLKCFFALSGHLNVKIVYAAASQCNVSSDLTGIQGYLDGLVARYRQALRHMWGAMDTGYAIRQSFAMVKRHKRAKIGQKSDQGDVGGLLLLLKNVLGTGAASTCDSNFAPKAIEKVCVRNQDLCEIRPAYHKPIHFWNVLLLYNSLFEAHFLPVHLALILTTTTIYDIIAGSLVPRSLALALHFSGVCRGVGWALIGVYFYRYSTYHRLCLKLREAEMREAGLLDGDTETIGLNSKLFGCLGLLEAVLFPIGGFLFGSIPACQAVLSHVFTDRLTYHVSVKPQAVRHCAEQMPKPCDLTTLPKKRARTISGTWRKQAMAHFDHFTSAVAFNQPVQRKD